MSWSSRDVCSAKFYDTGIASQNLQRTKTWEPLSWQSFKYLIGKTGRRPAIEVVVDWRDLLCSEMASAGVHLDASGCVTLPTAEFVSTCAQPFHCRRQSDVQFSTAFDAVIDTPHDYRTLRPNLTRWYFTCRLWAMLFTRRVSWHSGAMLIQSSTPYSLQQRTPAKGHIHFGLRFCLKDLVRLNHANSVCSGRPFQPLHIKCIINHWLRSVLCGTNVNLIRVSTFNGGSGGQYNWDDVVLSCRNALR